PVRHMLRRLIAAPAAIALVWPMLLIIGASVAWHRWGIEMVGRQYHTIDSTKIELTTAPEYIRSDIVQRVFDNTNLGSVSLWDQQAPAKIAEAFSTSGWVENVVGVEIQPGGYVRVLTRYRKPVALVLTISKSPETYGQPAFFVVDRQGVLLPSDLTQQETRDYLYIETRDDVHHQDVGNPFGDYRVESAAALAELLNPVRRDLGLRAIQPVADPNDPRLITLYLDFAPHLGRTPIIWGSPLGDELPTEPSAEAKLAALVSSDQTMDDLRFAREKDPPTRLR
ncbi:MAG: hypothetical protein AAFN70_08730, partial [Planctomycetota bacterium]